MSFAPVYSPASRAILLGSWPSPKSWQQGFYYGHPQNRFWPLLAAIVGSEPPCTLEQKRQLILQNGLALWDVLERCTVTGAADASIKDPVPVDLSALLQKAPIRAVFCNGATAHTLYQRLLLPQTGISAIKLPSTSPANASFSPQRLLQAWQPALQPWLCKEN